MWMTLHIENRAVVFIHTMIDYLFFMFLRESLPTEPLVWGGFSCIYRRCIYIMYESTFSSGPSNVSIPTTFVYGSNPFVRQWAGLCR